MKFKIKQRTIINNLNKVIRGVSNKNLIPILGCIKFELKETGLFLTSTDNEISIEVCIAEKDILEIEDYGRFVINGRFFYELIRKLNNTDITFEYQMDGKLIISTIMSSFTLNTNNVNDFPTLDFTESKDTIKTSNKLFKNMIDKTIFATSLSETRPVLTGINLKVKNNEFISTTTDSYRLSKYLIKSEDAAEFDVIIPQRTVNEIVKIIDEDEEIEIHIYNNKIMFITNNLKLVSRLINGTYPNTDKLIPDDSEIQLKVNLTEFYEAIDRAALLTTELDKNTVKMENTGDKIVIKSTLQEVGNIEEIINCENLKDKNIKIAFSSKFMLDSLKSFNCTEVILKFNGEVKPIIVASETDENNIQLILPIRTY